VSGEEFAKFLAKAAAADHTDMRQPQTIPGLGAILRLAAPEGAALKNIRI